MISAGILQEIKLIEAAGMKIDATESEGMVCIVIHNYQLARSFNKVMTDLLIMLPLSYPSGKPDMFWIDSDVLLSGGAIPQSADQIETHLNRQWRRFSWHLATWNPSTDNLITYIEFVNARLSKGV
jgi:hypothetical protein